MILRATALGFLLWLIGTAAFRFAADTFFQLDQLTPLYAATAPAMALITFCLLKLLRVSRGDEAEGAIGLAAPGILLDVYAMAHFTQVFPNIDPLLAPDFGALLLLAYGAMLVTGVLMTRLSPADERIVGKPPIESDPAPPAP